MRSHNKECTPSIKYNLLCMALSYNVCMTANDTTWVRRLNREKSNEPNASITNEPQHNDTPINWQLIFENMSL